MKKPARAINKDLCFDRGFHPISEFVHGSFKTIPNSLRQLPVKNLIIPEAILNLILLQLNWRRGAKDSRVQGFFLYFISAFNIPSISAMTFLV
jgi:hypothetical protein